MYVLLLIAFDFSQCACFILAAVIVYSEKLENVPFLVNVPGLLNLQTHGILKMGSDEYHQHKIVTTGRALATIKCWEGPSQASSCDGGICF